MMKRKMMRRERDDEREDEEREDEERDDEEREDEEREDEERDDEERERDSDILEGSFYGPAARALPFYPAHRSVARCFVSYLRAPLLICVSTSRSISLYVSITVCLFEVPLAPKAYKGANVRMLLLFYRWKDGWKWGDTSES